MADKTTDANFDPRDHLTTLKSKEGPKQYLPVAWRIYWFRSEHPDGHIATEAVVRDELECWFRATVSWPDGGSATGWARQTPADFDRGFVEKCETKSIGRALAALGYGTQFTDDFDEDENVIADTPVEPHQNRVAAQPKQAARRDYTADGSKGAGRPLLRATVEPSGGASEAATGHSGERPPQALEFAAICRRIGLVNDTQIRQAFQIGDLRVTEWAARDGWVKVIEAGHDLERWHKESLPARSMETVSSLRGTVPPRS